METVIAERHMIERLSGSLSEALGERSEHNTRCFICGRIYFGQNVRQCPRCGSHSVESCTTEDFAYYGRTPVADFSERIARKEPLRAGASE